MGAPPTPETLTGNVWTVFAWVFRTWRSWEWPMYVVLVPVVLAPVAWVLGVVRQRRDEAR
jgi:hypothetical protein